MPQASQCRQSNGSTVAGRKEYYLPNQTNTDIKQSCHKHLNVVKAMVQRLLEGKNTPSLIKPTEISSRRATNISMSSKQWFNSCWKERILPPQSSQQRYQADVPQTSQCRPSNGSTVAGRKEYSLLNQANRDIRQTCHKHLNVVQAMVQQLLEGKNTPSLIRLTEISSRHATNISMSSKQWFNSCWKERILPPQSSQQRYQADVPQTSQCRPSNGSTVAGRKEYSLPNQANRDIKQTCHKHLNVVKAMVQQLLEGKNTPSLIRLTEISSSRATNISMSSNQWFNSCWKERILPP